MAADFPNWSRSSGSALAASSTLAASSWPVRIAIISAVGPRVTGCLFHVGQSGAQRALQSAPSARSLLTVAASPEAMAAKKALPFVVVPAMAMPIGVRWPSRGENSGRCGCERSEE